MIPRRIDRADGNDNYRALALYIADSSIGEISGEKTFHSWYAGGRAENYLEGMIEVEATQALNTRAEGPKTYHLMVSFRPEDESKLSPEAFEELERILAEALGFAEHQRHCGVHRNTDNMHLHVAYSKINPEKLTCHTPYFDYARLHRACRLIEQKYGLAVDKGLEPGRPKPDGLADAQVKSIEAQTGQETLFSYVLRHKAAIITEIGLATDWREVHENFLKRGLHLKVSGNGLTIKDRYGQHYAKPSRVDRCLSKAALTGLFGAFEDAGLDQLRTVKAEETFSAAPLHQGPERDRLYGAFQEEMKRRREILEEIRLESARRYGAIKERWRKKWRNLELIPMMRTDRQKLRLRLKERKRAELTEMRAETAARRHEIRTEIPYTSWTKCLQHKAALGNETALAILRSRKEMVAPELQDFAVFQPVFSKEPDKWLENKKEIMEAAAISGRHRQALLAVIKMRELMEREAIPGQRPQEFTHSVDTKGTVIFNLSCGGSIRDTGREVHFSAHNEPAKLLAEKYAQAKWGPSIATGNAYKPSPGEAERKRQAAPER